MPDLMPQLPRSLITEDALPLYGRIATRLWEDIRAGGGRTGDRLPSERVLSQRYAVSRVTLRAALVELETYGLVRAAAARGWFIADGAAGAATAARHTIQGFADYAKAHGLNARSRVLRAHVRACTVGEAERLKIAPGSDIFEMRRLRFLDDLVVVLEHNCLPLALCPVLASVDFNTASLYATLRGANPAQVPQTANYSVEARRPDAAERELLQVDEHVAMLVATQLAFNQSGRPLEFSIAVYRSDRYRFQASITDYQP